MRSFHLNLRAAAAAAGVLCMLHAGSAAAVSLQQAYEAALKNDPAYRMNFYESEFGKENQIIGRSLLLPNVSASYSGSRNRADLDSLGAFGNRSLTHPEYISRSSSVQLRQPLVNMDALARYRQGVSQSKQSAAKLQADSGEVILRVVGAYVEALYSRDQLALTQAQRDMYFEQQQVNTRLFQRGEGTKTEMLETQARLDLAEAQLIEARDGMTATRTTLEGIIGIDAGTLDSLVPEIRFDSLHIGSFDEWKKTALVSNRDIEVGRLAVETARLEVDKAKAGHLPRLDLVATYSKGDSETLNTYTQNTVNRSVGIQLNIPLYAGGAVNAQSRQAVAGHERAKADLEGKTNKALLELRKAYDLVQSSVTRIGALQKATESGKELVKATEQSIKGGVRINLDLLNAQQQLVSSRRDLAQARYSYLLGLLRLRAAAGTLDASHVREIAAYFR